MHRFASPLAPPRPAPESLRALLQLRSCSVLFPRHAFRELCNWWLGQPGPLITRLEPLFTNSFRIRTSTKSARNSFAIRTSKNTALKVL